MSDMLRNDISQLKAHGLAVRNAGLCVQARIAYKSPIDEIETEILICSNACEKCNDYLRYLLVAGSTFEVTEVFETLELSTPSETQRLAHGA